ncbi:MAG: hypothetical protein ACI8QS_001184 [Planctomycetota bacterium]|jgi:hypothetical protein
MLLSRLLACTSLAPLVLVATANAQVLGNALGTVQLVLQSTGPFQLCGVIDLALVADAA